MIQPQPINDPRPSFRRYVGAPSGTASKLAHLGTDIVDANANIDTNRVITNSVSAGAINAQVSATSGSVGISATETQITSNTITTNGGWVEIFTGGAWQSPVNDTITFRVRKDSITGTILGTAILDSSTANVRFAVPSMPLTDTSPAASQVYVFSAQMNAGQTGTVNPGFLLTANRKR